MFSMSFYKSICQIPQKTKSHKKKRPLLCVKRDECKSVTRRCLQLIIISSPLLLSSLPLRSGLLFISRVADESLKLLILSLSGQVLPINIIHRARLVYICPFAFSLSFTHTLESGKSPAAHISHNAHILLSDDPVIYRIMLRVSEREIEPLLPF